MANGFDKLRLTATASVMGLLAGICGASRSARAAPFVLPGNITAGGVRYQMGNNTNAFNLPPVGLGVVDAAFVAAHPVDKTPSGTSSATLNDALDGGLVCLVNGTEFADPTGTVDVSPAAGGQKLTSNAATMGAFSAQMTYLFYSAVPAVRMICSVTNTTGSPQALTLQILSNLGSDNLTQIRGSSTSLAATTTSAADRWFVSIQAFSAGVSPDTRSLHGRYGTGAAVVPTMPFVPGVPSPVVLDSYGDQFSVTVNPGQTVSFMQFLWVNNTVAQAQASGPTLDSGATLQAAGMLSDLNATELSQILNYEIASASLASIPVPALDERGQFGLALLVGASGLLYMLRRRRSQIEKE